MWEFGDYMCEESQDTHGRRETPAKCRELGTLCMKKLTCLSRLPCEEMIMHCENLLLLHERRF